MAFREGCWPMKLLRVLGTNVLLLLTFGLSLHFMGYNIAAQEGVNRAIEGLKNPQALDLPKPSYTEEARQAGIEGIVLLQVIVRKDGTANGFKVLKGLGYGLDESAISTIADKWRFQPGTYYGVPVDMQIQIEVTFRLHPSDYSLRASIVEIKWDSTSHGSATGSGHGNLREGVSYQGFDFTCSCDESFNPTRGSNGYPAKWIKAGGIIEILYADLWDVGKKNKCELNVILIDQVYLRSGGRLITVTLEQWRQMENMRAKAPVVPAGSSAPPQPPQNGTTP
jgi:TonB family protein